MGSLQGKIRDRLAQIVQRVTVGPAILFKLSMSEGQDQHGRLAGPSSIGFYQHARQLFMIFGMVPGGHQKRPGLLVAGGCRLSGSLEQGQKFVAFDRSLRERAPAPSLANEVVDRHLSFG